MYEEDLLALEKRAKFSKSSRLLRLFKEPVHLGSSKLLEYYAYFKKKGVECVAKTFWGDEINVVFPEIVSMRLYRYGYFEENLTKVFMTHLKTGMVFFDVGAHFGYYSLLGSMLVGNKGKVCAFEPSPTTFSMLNKNIENRPNTSAFNLAVFSKNTTLDITDFGTTYSAFNSIGHGNIQDNIKSKIQISKSSIKTISIDSFIQGAGVIPDFIKIDAEGSELDILNGMKVTLKEYRPIVTLEVGDISGVGESTSSRKVVEHMLLYDYRCLECEQGKLIEHVVRDRYLHDNLLFLPA